MAATVPGYAGKQLRVNLKKKKVKVEKIKPVVLRKYLGGVQCAFAVRRAESRR